MKKIIFICLFFFSANFIYSQETDFKPSGKVWGLVFGDYFYKISGGDSLASPTEYSHISKDYNAFEFRRIYLGFDYNISPKFSSEFIASYEGGDLTSNSNRTFFVKDANLKWKEIFDRSDLVVGLMATPSFLLSERVWGYRSIEKTIMDMRGTASSRDIGVSLRGFFDEGKFYGYNVTIGNGRGTRLENNKYKKFYSLLYAYFLEKKLLADFYFDFEPQSTNLNKITYKGFMGYQTEKFAAGVEIFQQENVFSSSGPTVKSRGIMSFINGEIIKDRLRFFGRFDYFDPHTDYNLGYKENFITAGLDIMPDKNVHFMPNIWVNTFNKKSEFDPARDSDIVGRLTFFYTYR
jgi:hypothetical protein